LIGEGKMQTPVGRVIRSSTTRFAAGCQVLRPHVPVFGALVKVWTVAESEVYGLIHDVRMEDDPYVRQIAALSEPLPEVVEDHRHNRQVPIEVGVLVVGYRRSGRIHHRLPPQPPLSLDVIHTCLIDELIAFTQHFGYFRLVLDTHDVPSDELLAAHLSYAAQARGPDGSGFLVDAGRELARLLAVDQVRLDAMLRRIRP
jgi:hypothetical protein